MQDESRLPHNDTPAAGDDRSYIRYLELELEQARKFEEIGMMAGVVAHDLNNMLTPIFGYSTILKRDMDKDHPLAKAVGVIEKSAERAAMLVGKLLGCSRQQQPLSIPFDVLGMLENFLESLDGKACNVEKSYAPVPAAIGDPHQIAVVIRSVIGNAIEAMAQGGTLSVGVATVTIDTDFCRHHPPVKPGSHVCITIVDTGAGMSPDVLEKAFEPFFSTKTATHCSGTGLTIAHSLLRKNSGSMDLESVEGNGTTVRIFLPAVTDSAL